MPNYWPYFDFTPQSNARSALARLHLRLSKGELLQEEYLTIVVFTAFAIEGYINGVGSRHIHFWEELERLPWKSKVEILHKHAARNADWGQEPLQFAVEVFRLRDKLAHGKPETVKGPRFETSEEALDFLNKPDAHLILRPAWYSKLTAEWLHQSRERTRALMLYIGNMYGLHEGDYQLSATGGIVDDQD